MLSRRASAWIIIEWCYDLNYASLQNTYEVITFNMAIFGGRVFQEVIKV
jgi:hypothetical protein